MYLYGKNMLAHTNESLATYIQTCTLPTYKPVYMHTTYMYVWIYTNIHAYIHMYIHGDSCLPTI